MTGPGLWPSLAAVAGILLFATACGGLLVRALLPRGAGWRIERAAWSVAIGFLLLAVNVVLCFSLRLRPGWISFVLISAMGAVLAHRFALPRTDALSGVWRRLSPLGWILLVLSAGGAVIYLLWSLEEPLASNDYFAIWGLKGKSLYGDAAIPGRLFDWPQYAFSNPAYPIGLPILYAGVAFLLGRWDDHAMALLFPFFQAATLLALAGWLKRRGSSSTIALAADALVASFAALYSPVMTGGMAEVPAAFTFLLVGVAFCDCLEKTDGGPVRRLALAGLLAAPVKNEGVFLLGAAFGLLVLWSLWKRRKLDWRVSAALLLPALGSYLLHRAVLGGHALRAFDFGLIWKPGFAGLLRDAFREAFEQLVVPFWLAVAALLFLVVFAGKPPAFGFLMGLAGASLAAYLVLPAFCTLGPAWLVHWTSGRIISALAPIAAAGIAAGWGFPISTLEKVDQPIPPGAAAG
ncbi:MAG TPA: hypothetical protein VKG01_05605 [Thermoanaerobaculia bacterium]|nr:hypothetical protein [Thermoanaerobaculia bacterium]